MNREREDNCVDRNERAENAIQQELHHHPHVGMRKIKSLLAVFTAFWVWQPVRLFFPDMEVHPIFIYIYSLIEIRDTSEKTVDLGRARIKATFVALMIGLPMIALSEILKQNLEQSWMHIATELAILLVGILITLVVAEELGCNAYCGLAAAIYIILTVYHANDERYLYAVLRASQTVVGVFIAWVINVKLMPYPSKNEE